MQIVDYEGLNGLAGTIQLQSFANLRKLDLWHRLSDADTIDQKVAEWVWATSPPFSNFLYEFDGGYWKLAGEFVVISSHVACQLSALVSLEELVSNPQTLFVM